MASEGRQRLLPIPRSAREYPAAEHLQAAHQSTVVPGTRTPQSTCPQKVGDSHSVVRKMDTAPEGPAPLSPSSLLRHPSFIRAVCVDALVRICAGGDQTWSSLLRPQHAPGIMFAETGLLPACSLSNQVIHWLHPYTHFRADFLETALIFRSKVKEFVRAESHKQRKNQCIGNRQM